MDQARHFFDLLFGDAPDEGHRVLIWGYPSKRSAFFTNVDDAAAHAHSIEDEQDVYFGLSLIGSDLGPNQRGKKDATVGIGGLWVDIDFATDDKKIHAKKNLPVSLDEARAILEKAGGATLEPSVIVDSGHGLHVYWLFQEPWLFDTDKDRQDAQALVRGWCNTVNACAKTLGFVVDPAHDVTRVFRVPGTFNRKSDPPLPVKIIEPRSGEPKRYQLDDFDPYLIAEATQTESRPYDPIAPVQLVASASPPSDRFDFLMQNDVIFRKTWTGRRGDCGDGSPSSYDLALANICVQHDWTDQEIADSIIARRRERHQKPEKAMRRDYIMSTIAKARETFGSASAIREIDSTSPPSPEEVDDGKRDGLLKKISQALGLKIIRAIKHGEERSTYNLVVDVGIKDCIEKDVLVGTIDALLSQEKARGKIADATGVVIKIMKRPTWLVVAQTLLNVAEIVHNEESTRFASIVQMLMAYISDPSRYVYRDDGWETALANNDPFIRGADLYVHRFSLMKHIKHVTGNWPDDGSLMDQLRIAGFQSLNVYGKPDPESQRVCRSYWKGPLTVILTDQPYEMEARNDGKKETAAKTA